MSGCWSQSRTQSSPAKVASSMSSAQGINRKRQASDRLYNVSERKGQKGGKLLYLRHLFCTRLFASITKIPALEKQSKSGVQKKDQ